MQYISLMVTNQTVKTNTCILPQMKSSSYALAQLYYVIVVFAIIIIGHIAALSAHYGPTLATSKLHAKDITC